jgi:monoamine oxidase
VLGVPAAYFFIGAPTPNASGITVAPVDEIEELASLLASAEGARLAKAFVRINNRLWRRRMIELAQSLCEDAEPS